MFTHYSIRKRFFIQLFIASLTLIFIFTSFTYLYIQNSVLDEKKAELLQIAQNIASYQSLYNAQASNATTAPDISITLVHLMHQLNSFDVYQSTINNQHYMTILYPFKLQDLGYLKVTKDITPTIKLLDNILRSLFIINIFGILILLLYAVTLSKMLIVPITILTKRLSNMNEKAIHPLNIERIPLEFEALGETLNHLINRVQTFVKYQKELFIGTAHELKTPLAVIKLKNQVTMIKQRSAQEYIEALKVTNKTIDDMDIIISNILNIGRQEGAQLEKPMDVDIITILKNKAKDFQLLASHENKTLSMDIKPDTFPVTIQVALLNQIVQNFLQNALKFTPINKEVKILSYASKTGLIIDVVDEGCGIDTSADLFAPFKRQGNKKGVGLGLFLAKSAADAMGARIELKNREDGVSGTIARLTLTSKPSCTI